MVEDSAQAIYAWRGATDVMTRFDGVPLALTQSFRFGPHLAREANRWLPLAGAPIRLQGTETIPTRLDTVETPDVFSSWGELQDYAAYDPAGADLQPFVDLIDTHTPGALLAAVSQLVDEQHAQVTVSTAHKAKGREWPTVQIGNDFRPPKDAGDPDAQARPVPGPIDDAEARLAYVAVTRARGCLDLGELAWIHDHPGGSPV